MKELCIVPCGSKKIWEKEPNSGPTKAKEVYTGPFASACRNYALHFYPSSWCILSTKHGFLCPDDVVNETYDVPHFKSDGAINLNELIAQAKEKNLCEYEKITVVAGKEYVEKVKEIFKKICPDMKICAPLRRIDETGKMIGMGKMMHVMAEAREQSHKLPCNAQ